MRATETSHLKRLEEIVPVLQVEHGGLRFLQDAELLVPAFLAVQFSFQVLATEK